jgi:5'-deoxynucleotidase YfbR-like HD superfamily hydrolase
MQTQQRRTVPDHHRPRRTSANGHCVATLGLTVSDQSTQMEMQAIANKLDALIYVL